MQITGVQLWLQVFLSNMNRRILHGIVVNVLDCEIVVSEFEIQSRYYT